MNKYDMDKPPRMWVRATANNMSDKSIVKWSNDQFPAIGDRVHVRINNFGSGTVVAYFIEHGFLGVQVKLENPPDWYKKQRARQKINFPNDVCLVYGTEIDVTVKE